MDETMETTIYATPAAVSLRATDTELLTLARKLAPDPSIFDEVEPLLWGAEATNNRLDAYFTRMHESSLKNFAEDLNAGISFQDSHLTRKLGLGRSLSGRYVGAQGNGVAHVIGEFYSIPGLAEVDNFWRGVRSGVYKDVSIGFYSAEFRCSVCGGDAWKWWGEDACHHIAGMEYDILDEKGNVKERATAFYWVKNARLSEVSIVYDGATPGAEIIKVKAQREADAGRLRPEAAQVLEQRYRIKLPGARHAYAGTTFKEERMEEQARENPPATEEAAVIEATTELVEGTSDAERTLAEIRAILVEAAPRGMLLPKAARWLADEVARLRPLADDGAAYRGDLIAEALAEGVRAFGAGFAQETYKGVLAGATLDTIKRMKEDWRAVGDKLFPGGRLTQDGAGDSPRATTTQSVPDAAFAA
jgi:hypothetical protein